MSSIEETNMNNQELLGGISQRGIIDNMNLSGMNSLHALLELVHNSFDARIPGKKITFKIIKRQNGNIAFIDDAMGMGIEGMAKALTLAERNKHGKQVGIAGMGLQNALKCLSNGESVCRVSGKTENGEFLSYDIPWKDIIEQGIMQLCKPSKNIEEIKRQFEEDRKEMGRNHGVTVEILTSPASLWEELLTFVTPDYQPDNKKYEEFKKWPHNSLGYTGPLMNDLIIYDDRNKKNYTPYPRYNITDLPEQETYIDDEMGLTIYKNVRNETIKKFIGKRNGKYYETQVKGGGFSKEPTELSSDPYAENKDYIQISNLVFKIKTVIQKDDKYFNLDDSKEPGAGKHRFPLQEKCGWDDDDTFLNNNQYTQICRNGIVFTDTLLHEKHLNPRSNFNTRIPVLVSSTIFIDYDNNHPDAQYLHGLIDLAYTKMNGTPKLPTDLRRLLLSCIDRTAKNFEKIVEDAVSKKAEEEAAANKKAEEEAAANKKAEEEATAKKKAEEEAAAKKRIEEEEEHKNELIDSDNDGFCDGCCVIGPSDNETEKDEDEDDSNEKEEVKIDEPNKKKLGPGEQTRQTKRNVKLTFENEIPKRIQEIEDEEERKEYEADISELIYEMMMDKCDRHGNRQQFVVKRFRNTPWKELLPDLWEYCYNNKLDDEYVTGGSRLYKFMNK